MLFPTVTFAVFFLVVYVANWLTMPRPRLWRWTIIAASYVFYGWWDWRFLLLLVAATLGNQFFALRLAATRGDEAGTATAGRPRAGSPSPSPRTSACSASSSTTTSSPPRSTSCSRPSGWAPRCRCSTSSLPGRHLVPHVPHAHLRRRRLPRGRSTRRRRSTSPSTCAFFPYLLAGPIARAAEFLPQLRAPRDPRERRRGARLPCSSSAAWSRRSSSPTTSPLTSSTGCSRPRSSTRVGRRWSASTPTRRRSTATSAATPTSPSASRCCSGSSSRRTSTRRTRRARCSDFWRRWHITLSTWLRDYLYIPLGGNRGGRGRTTRNLMLTMLLGGLWHGAGWTFVLWGGLHGAALVGRARARRPPAPRSACGPGATPPGPACWRRFADLPLRRLRLGLLPRRHGRRRRSPCSPGWSPASGASATPSRPTLLALVALGIGIQFVPRALTERLEAGFVARRLGRSRVSAWPPPSSSSTTSAPRAWPSSSTSGSDDGARRLVERGRRGTAGPRRRSDAAAAGARARRRPGAGGHAAAPPPAPPSAAMLLGFFLAGLLDAAALRRDVETLPLGARRTRCSCWCGR